MVSQCLHSYGNLEKDPSIWYRVNKEHSSNKILSLSHLNVIHLLHHLDEVHKLHQVLGARLNNERQDLWHVMLNRKLRIQHRNNVFLEHKLHIEKDFEKLKHCPVEHRETKDAEEEASENYHVFFNEEVLFADQFIDDRD